MPHSVKDDKTAASMVRCANAATQNVMVCRAFDFPRNPPISRVFAPRTLRLAALMLIAAQCLLGARCARCESETFYQGASEVYRCRFERTDDEEFNGWPPRWTRYHSQGYPKYLKFRLTDVGPPSGGRSFRVELDGGAAAAYSPKVVLRAGVNYVLAGFVRTDGLQRDHALLSMTFLDRAGKKLASTRSRPIQENGVWKRYTVGPVVPPPAAQSIVIGLLVEPDKTGEDLSGSVSFGDLWLGVLPRFTLVARIGDRPAVPIFRRNDPVEVHCTVSGFGDAAEAIEFRLEDQQGQILAKQRAALAAPQERVLSPEATVLSGKSGFAAKTPVASDGMDSGLRTQDSEPKAIAEASWSPPVDLPGFYRVRAAIVHRQEQMAAADITLVIVDPPFQNEVEGFGWTLAQGSQPLGWKMLPDVLREAGIGWIRYPFACGAKADPAMIESYLEFCEKLNRNNISVAGILVPPVSDVAKDALLGKAAVAVRERLAIEAFDQKPDTWYPAIEPLMARLATQIRCWQLGNDRDPGWIGCQELGRLVGRPRGQLDRIAQNVSMGVAWDWTSPFPNAQSLPLRTSDSPGSSPEAANTNTSSADAAVDKRPVEYLALLADAKLSARKMADRLDQTRGRDIARWVVLEPLPPEGNDLQRRAGNLADRMILAKMHGAEAIFLSDPFDARLGLIRADGAPQELFLPWRTTALILGGTQYLGNIDLPGGHSLRCFGRNGRCVAVVPAEAAGNDSIYLGDDVRQVDLFGRSVARPAVAPANERGDVSAGQPLSTIAIDELPGFLTGLNESITRWHLGMTLDTAQLPSVPNVPYKTTLTITNSFPQTVSGRVALVAPKNWRVDPPTAEFHLGAGQTVRQPLEITLPSELTGGRRTLRIDVEVQADRTYRFAAFRPLEVSLGDVVIEAVTRLNERGDLEIVQTLVNNGKKPVSFRCQLFVPDRRRQAVDLVAMPDARDQTIYRLPNGRQLLGKTLWLHAEEINGNRVMNYPLAAPRSAAAATITL